MHKKIPLSYAAAGKMTLSASLVSASEAVTVPISVSGTGKMGTGESSSSSTSFSSDGQFIAFESDSPDLVSDDTNGVTDVFVRDVINNTTTRVSVDSSGFEANAGSYSPSISADGRYISFSSAATNLDDIDEGNSRDIFVHDRVTGETTRVSQESLVGLPFSGKMGGSKNPSISANGRYIAYDSGVPNLVQDDTDTITDVFVYDRITGVTTNVSIQDIGSGSFNPSISADGRYIAFEFVDKTSTLYLDDGSVSMGNRGIFVYDRLNGTTEQVSVNSAGEKADFFSSSPSISGNGRYIAFDSYATNLVSNDTNCATDIFVHDRLDGSTERVSVNSSDEPGNYNQPGPNYQPFPPIISCDDGLFTSSRSPSISADGRYIAFSSDATNLVRNDINDEMDIFVHDRLTELTSRVNIGESGEEANNYSVFPSITAHGNYIAFTSKATNLVSNGDHIGTSDVFIRGLLNPLEPINIYKTSFELTAWPERWYSYG